MEKRMKSKTKKMKKILGPDSVCGCKILITSFFAFPNHSHNTLANHFEPSQALPTPLLRTMEHPTPLFMLHPSPSADPSKPTLGNHEAPKPFFMLHFQPSQALPTPLLGIMRSTQTPFHVSFLAFPNPSHPTLGSHEAPKPLFMLHFEPSQAVPTLLLETMKHAVPFSCVIFCLPKPFPQHSWEPF